MSRKLVVIAAAIAVAAGAVAVVLATRDGQTSQASRQPRRVLPVEGDQLRVARVLAEPLHVIVGQPVELAVDVEHGTEARGALHYQWSVPGGALQGDDADAVVWTAPGKPGRKKVKVTVTDGTRTASGSVMIEVRLPSPSEVANLGDLMRQQQEKRDLEVAELITSELRVSELEQIAAQGETISDLLKGQEALEEMAGLLAELGRYEDARVVWDRLMANMLPGASKHASFSARIGDVAFMLGDEDGALAAWKAGGAYTQGMSRYYQGELLERRGDRAGAIEAYAAAQDGARWYGDIVYRHALLLLEDGADEAAVAAMLVDASSQLDGERMMARFDSDPETVVLGRLLRDTGRAGDLVAQQPLTIDAEATPSAAPRGGGG